MQKRFIYALNTNWYANETANKTTYKDSVVFIHDENGKGVEIFTQGAYFKTDVQLSDIEPLIKAYLKEGSNITLTTTADGDLEIAAKSVDSLTGKSTSTELVQAQAVAGALTIPVSLTLSVVDGVGTFSEIFSTLNGDTTEAVTAVFKEGDYIDLTDDGGLKISVDKASLATDLKTDLDYNSGNVITVNAEDRTINHNEVAATTKTTGTAINPTEDAKTFDIKSYGFDKYGHISTETTTTVTLPDNAFKNDNTTYDLDATANETEGVDVNLKGNDNTTDTVTFVGGSNVEVALVDGKVEISSSYVNDNTTYTGENAIDVAQPVEGSTQGKVTLKIDSTDKVLTQSASGLKTNLEIDYVSSTNKIRLTNGTDMISEFDASVFVKDSLLKDVEIVEENAEGTKGNYLKFTFETIDTDGTGKSVDSTKVIYVDIKDFYVKTTVSKDDNTYTSVTKTGDDYKVSNVLGTISRDNASNTITVSKDGIATVADIKTILETIDSDLDATVEGTHANEIAVVTGITQVDGKITAVDSSLAATKTYVDNAINALDVTESTIGTKNANDEGNTVTVIDQITYSETDGKVSISASTTTAATKTYVDGVIAGLDSNLTADSQYFTKVVITDGKLDTEESTKANISEAKLNGYSNTVVVGSGISSTDTINSAIAKLETTLDWGTI